MKNYSYCVSTTYLSVCVVPSQNLQFSLPIVTVSIILFIMAIVIIIVMRKARYGQFCCLKPVSTTLIP